MPHGRMRLSHDAWPARALRAPLVAAVLALLALALVPVVAFGSEPTQSGDTFRDGWYPEQGSLTPQLVSGGTFGQLWSAKVEGSVYAQPLLVSGEVLIATENNKIYGLDPGTGAAKWSTSLVGTAWKAGDISCNDLAPNVGVTGTPVVDPSTNTAYMTHKAYASGSSGTVRWYMDAINLANGQEREGFPVQLAGSAQNQPGMTFNPTSQLQRPGLLLLNGVVYAAFGSDCDFNTWQGWVFGVSTAGAIKARWVAVPSGNGAGIWQSGAGLFSDGPNTLMVSTGNTGANATPTPGKTPPNTFGESIVRLVVQPNGELKPTDFFEPFDALELDQNDADFASGGITGLNDEYFGTPAVPHLAVAVGKDGYVYLLDREELGGFMQGTGKGDKVVQRLGPYGGVWSRPGVWPGNGGWVYIPTASAGNSAGGSTGFLRVYQYGVSGEGKPTLSLQATSSDAWGFGTGAPVITSEGTTSGSALVWSEWMPNGTGEGAQLRAYDPVPVNGKPVLRWSGAIGTGSKFGTPGVGANKLFVGNREGKVLAFGSPVTPALSGPSTSFPTTTIGQSSSKTVTLTANKSLTVSKITTSNAQFTIGTTTPPVPAAVGAGQTVQVPITFKPTGSGLQAATLTVETTEGTMTFSLQGTGQPAEAKVEASPVVLSFGGTTVGGKITSAATFRNVGGAPLTINGVAAVAAPFFVTGAPEAGKVLAPGEAVTVQVTFEPTAEGSFSGELTLETSAGASSVALAGAAGKQGVLKIAPEAIEYGSVPAGSTVSKSFTLTNTGGTNVTITKSKPPIGGAFSATTTLSEGTTIAPGETLTETVAFKPSAPGAASGAWLLNGDDTSGSHEVKFTGTGTVPAPGPGWSHNGSATITSGVVQTTAAVSNEAGSAFFETPLASNHLVIEFDQTIGSGSGADGQTLTFADATKAAPTALGEQGGGLGFAGISGIAVAFDTYKNSVNPSSNFAGITDGSAGAGLLHWLATSTAIPALRTATRHVKIETLNGTVNVSVEGTKYLSTAVTLPEKVYVGFTGGTGGSNDIHKAANVTISGETAAEKPKEEPPAASLRITNAITAPSGSPQAETTLAYSGTCPSSFTTAAIGNGGSATPTLTGAVQGSSCSVAETAPTGTGWKTTASVNGAAPVEIAPSAGKITVPGFLLAAGANTVAFTNTYTPPKEEPPAASLRITNAISAPSGSPQAETTLAYSGTCPSSFTTAAIGNGGSATPTLTGAVQGSSCSVAETAPTGTGWKTTASVNGAAPVEIAPSAGKITVPGFLLAAGANTVAFTNTYTPPKEEGGVPSIPDPSAGGWQINGNALIESASLVLTTATANQAGSAFWPTKVDPRNLAYEFTISIGGGSGADGLAFVIADATKSAPTALGEQGGGLGFAGTSGFAVAFDTWQNSVNPSNNFIGISDGAGTSAGTLHWLTTFSPLPSSLRTGTHKIRIETGEGGIAVWEDATKIGSLAVALPASAYVGFSGGTGGSTDRHAISGLTVAGTGAKEEPKPASLSITNTISAPTGSPQAETTLAYSGTCPSSFTTAALGNGGSVNPTLTGAVQGANCSVAETAPTGTGWKTTVSINGAAPVELKEAGSTLTAPAFALAAGSNTVAFTNTYTPPKEEPPAASLRITNAISAPSGLAAGRNHARLQRHLPVQLHDRRDRQRRLGHPDAHRRRPGLQLLGRRDRAHRHRLEDHRLRQRRRPRRNRPLRRQDHRARLPARRRRQHRRLHQHLHAAQRRRRRPVDPRPERRWLADQRQRLDRKRVPRAHDRHRQPGRKRLLADQGRPPQPRLRIHDLDRRRQRRRRPRVRDRRRHQRCDRDLAGRKRRRARVRESPGLGRRLRHVQELREPLEQLHRHQRRRRHQRRHAALAHHVLTARLLASDRYPQGQGRHGGRDDRGLAGRHETRQRRCDAARLGLRRLLRRDRRLDRPPCGLGPHARRRLAARLRSRAEGTQRQPGAGSGPGALQGSAFDVAPAFVREGCAAPESPAKNSGAATGATPLTGRLMPRPECRSRRADRGIHPAAGPPAGACPAATSCAGREPCIRRGPWFRSGRRGRRTSVRPSPAGIFSGTSSASCRSR